MEIARQFLSVLAVFALLGVALWTLRRSGSPSFGLRRLPFGIHPPARPRSLQSVERLALTPQHSLHLVRIDGRAVVVATHPHGCALLMERPE